MKNKLPIMGITGFILILGIILGGCSLSRDSPPPKKDIVKIEIKKLPHKTSYLLGEVPVFDGLEVKVVFTDGSEAICSDYTARGNTFISGTRSVTVQYANQSAAFDIQVAKDLVDTGLPVVYIETENKGEVNSKNVYVKATMTIKKKGNIEYEAGMKIRGRGNATWDYPKKPYKIKLDDKAGLLGMDSDKDWVLLANYCDKSLMRTGIALKAGELLEFPWTPKARFVELVMNGEYLGNYQLAEGVKQGKNRVDIPKTGFLIEKDSYYREEPVWFETSRGYGYSFKNPDPEKDLNAEQKKYIQDYLNEFESALDSDFFDDPGKGYQKYINLESFVRWYLFQQVIANLDPNIYLYKADSGSGSKLLMGPPWDFEWSLGIGWYYGERPRPANYYVMDHDTFYYNKILQDKAFVAKLQEMWKQYKVRLRQELLAYMDVTKTEIMRSQELNFRRWDILKTMVSVGGIPLGSFDAETACDRQFFINHIDWLEQELGT
ncbi:MAG: CotH kinase family protein [Treponema sp.]|jgi:hypothetical protein|nr:CotH kinase family protein [Treponema sp.]